MSNAMLEHCQRAYEIMANDADENGEWQGKVSDIALTLNLGSTIGSKIFANLKSMACIEELRRGTGSSFGIYKLLEFPTHQHWNHMNNAGDPVVTKDNFKPRRVTNYVQMASQLSKMQEALVQIIAFVNAQDEQIKKMQEKLDMVTAIVRNKNGDLGTSK